MAKCSRDSHPNLFGYLDAYGLDDNVISKIDRIKGNSHTGYYVLGWKDSSGRINMLDLSNTPDRNGIDYRDKSSMEKYNWNMLNDGMGTSITEKDWNKIKIDDYCETFYIPDHEEYGQ